MYAICVVLLGCIAFPFFISTLTGNVVKLQGIHKERAEKRAALAYFLKVNAISGELALRAKMHLNVSLDGQHDNNHVEVLQLLPKDMQFDIYDQLHSPYLVRHRLVKYVRFLRPGILRQLSSVVVEHTFAQGNLVFAVGTPCTDMSFIARGNLVYTWQGDTGRLSDGPKPAIRGNETLMKRALTAAVGRHSARSIDFGSQKLGAKAWVCEAALWTPWSTVGELLVRSAVAVALSVDAEALLGVVEVNPEVARDVVLYSHHFVKCMRLHWGSTACTDCGVHLTDDV